MTPKIPATVVTGFLGAGKTTLIRHLLENAGGRRIALIINEFGDLGVDGDILKGCGIEACREEDVVELSNGCLCCTVAEDFVPAIEALLARDEPPEHIVIETSGLALPQPLVQAFAWPEIRTRVTVDGVVAVVDGPAVAAGRFAANPGAVAHQRASDDALDHEAPLHELFEDQIAAADLILVNKADLMAKDDAEALAAHLAQRARSGVRARTTSRAVVDPRVLLGLGIGAETDLEARHGHHHHDADHPHDHDHDDFQSAVIEMPELPNAEALVTALQRVITAQDILRVKGFAAIDGRAMRLVVQAVGPRIDTHHDRPFRPGEPRQTRLVVIAETGFDPKAFAETLLLASEPVA
ncbi:MAG: cobalamin biosynthesis protein CobW [Pseudomonadota bacterium]